MKKIYVLFSLLLTCATVFAQSFSLQLVGSAGGQANNGPYQCSWSVGEPVTATASAGPFMLTQGFQQSNSPSAVAAVLTNVSCYGGSNGSVTVSVSGGNLPLTYVWSTSPVQTTQTATGLTAGPYWVTVTDASSSTAISSTTVTEPAAALTATAGVLTPVSCYGGSNGSVDVTVSGGTSGYSYAWSTIPVQTTHNATGLTAGTYLVTVTDAHSCTATSSATLAQPPKVVPGLSGPETLCQNATGNVYTTDPGMSNYHWVVSAGGIVTAGGTSSDNSVTITWNSSGAKSVSINYTAPPGCTADDPTIKNITVNPLPSPDISGPAVVNQGETVTYSTPFVSGHVYNWNVVFGTFVSCDPNCITVTWAHYCNITVPGQVTVTETNPVTGCSKTVTLLITIN